MRVILTLFAVLSSWSFCLMAQNQTDTVLLKTVVKDTVTTIPQKRVSTNPSPKKALLLSAVLPGAGQIYNKKYWKLPIVYGAIGGFGYLVYQNTTIYRRLKSDYIDVLAGKTATYYPNLSATSLKVNRDKYRYQMEQSYLGLILTYLLTGVDAYVDAHLKSFDIKDDLSIRLDSKPDFMQNANYGLTLTVSLK